MLLRARSYGLQSCQVNQLRREEHSKRRLRRRVIVELGMLQKRVTDLYGGRCTGGRFLLKPFPRDEQCGPRMLQQRGFQQGAIILGFALTCDQIRRISAEGAIPNPPLMSDKNLLLFKLIILRD